MTLVQFAPAPTVPGAAWPVVVACDGGVLGSPVKGVGQPAGAWAYCWVGPDQTLLRAESGLLLPAHVGGPGVTNNQTEFYGLLMLLESLPPGWWGTLHMDSKITRGRAFEGDGLRGIPAPWADRLLRARDRLALDRLTVVLVKGHPTQPDWDQADPRDPRNRAGQPISRWNVWCDHRCTDVLTQYKESQHG